jgi:hypothetical protein
VFLEKGKITGIQWDTNFDRDSCFAREPIIPNACPSKFVVDPAKCGDEKRKLKIFIGFVGTDGKKVPLTSAQLMPSTFQKFGVGGIVDSVTDLINLVG